MKTINSEMFNELRKDFNPDAVCEDNMHDFASEIDCGTRTGDYICLKCYLYFNECDRKKYGLGDDKDEKDETD